MTVQTALKTSSLPLPKVTLALTIILGMLFQLSSYANHDTIVIIFSIEKWIQGGHYGTDFFNTLTPMSLILFYPPVKLASLLALSPTILTTLYVTGLALLTLWLTTHALKKMYDQAIINTWAIVYVSLLFFYVRNDFLQRDALCIILVLPYIVSLVTHAHQLRKPFYDFISAILAGFGFAIKPHFLVAWLCLEIYSAINHKSLTYLFRWQNWVIGSIVAGYALTIYYFFDDYLTQILPYIVNGFYKTYYHKQANAINNLSFLTWCAGIVYFLIYRQYHTPSKLVKILLVASVGFMFDYLLQGKSWFYHAIPMMVCFFLALTLSLVDFFSHRVKPQISSTNRTLKLSVAGILLYFIIILTLCLTYQSLRITYLAAFAKNNTSVQMTYFLKQHAHTPHVGLITADVRQGNLVIYYSGHRPATRFDHLWLLSSLILDAPRYDDLNDPTQQQTRQFVIDALTDDINRYKPDTVLVDNSQHKQYLYEIELDYIDYLSHDRRFKEALSHYRFLENKANYAIYKRIQSEQDTVTS